jgi:hypothetical protein
VEKNLAKSPLIYYNRSTACQVYWKEIASVINDRQVPTTEMQVTSIRLEQELKDSLKELAGHREYVHQRQHTPSRDLDHTQIRATLTATAQTMEYCTLTGQMIHPNEPMLLGLTTEGRLVPLASTCFRPEPAVPALMTV